MRILTIILFLTVCMSVALARSPRYAEKYCDMQGFHCIKVQKGEKWKTLWPDDEERHVVMKLNRMNTGLHTGMTIAVPDKFKSSTFMKNAPFPKSGESTGEKWIQVSLTDLAWGAYDADGKLVNWGPASGGKGWCPDIQEKCRTVKGTFKIQRKGTSQCKSKTFPVPDGGAPMPYCMFFHGGYAIHGSNEVPGFNASHGCVRIWVDDAKWLSENFVEIGTNVIVE